MWWACAGVVLVFLAGGVCGYLYGDAVNAWLDKHAPWIDELIGAIRGDSAATQVRKKL